MAGVFAALLFPAAERARDRNVAIANRAAPVILAGENGRELADRIRRGVRSHQDIPGVTEAPRSDSARLPKVEAAGRNGGTGRLADYIANQLQTPPDAGAKPLFGITAPPGGGSEGDVNAAGPDPKRLTFGSKPIPGGEWPGRTAGAKRQSGNGIEKQEARADGDTGVSGVAAAGRSGPPADDLMAMAPPGGAIRPGEVFTDMKRFKVASRERARTAGKTGRGVASELAFASLGEGGSTGGCGSATVVRGGEACGRESSYYFAAPPFPELPARGVKFWGGAEAFRENQDPWESGQNVYRQDRQTYSVGVTKDWTIDSTLGLSAEWLESKVQSRQPDDYRENKLSGYRLNAHYRGTCMAQLPFSATAFYGRVDDEGSGYTTSSDGVGGYFQENWLEPRHRTQIYGFSGKIGAPLLWGNDFKVLPEIGVDYCRVQTDPHSYSYYDSPGGTDYGGTMEGVTSKSLRVPMTVSVKKDYAQCWGIFSPKIVTGAVREFEDSAIGARVLNAASASKIAPMGATQKIEFQPSQKLFYHFGAGVELRTVGGWEVFADYLHHWSDEWRKDEFKLKLGRNF